MKNLNKQFVLFFAFLLIGSFCLSQKNEVVTMDQIKQKCSILPLEQRARLAVSRFNVTTATNDPATAQNTNMNNKLKALSVIWGGGGNAPAASTMPPVLGDNLTAMLTNALQQVGCYRVLESQTNSKDLTNEVDAGDSKYANKKSAPKAGRQLGPQVVVTGEITEYSVKEKGLKVVGVGANSKLVKIGFVVKMINAETRDVIASERIRVESKTGKSVSVLGLVSTDQSDPAVAAVMEDGVLKAVEYMGRMRDSLNLTSTGSFAGNSNSATGAKETEITLTSASYSSFTAFASIIASLPGYIAMDKSFSGGKGVFTVSHNGGSDALLDALTNKMGAKYEITGFDQGRIEVKAK